MAMDNKNRVVGNNADPEMKTKKRKKAASKKANGIDDMDVAAPVFLKSKYLIKINTPCMRISQIHTFAYLTETYHMISTCDPIIAQWYVLLIKNKSNRSFQLDFYFEKGRKMANHS